MADQSWKAQPAQVSAPTVRQAARRIGEHAATHGLPDVRVILHGGEPLLIGSKMLAFIAEQMREHIEPPARLQLSIQTNGVLLTRSILDVLIEHEIGVSVSIDGNRADHDRHRQYRNGRGSYHAVTAGIELLRDVEYRSLYRGLLCTVNLANDPIRTYEALAEFSPPRADFLLPHGNWTSPPPRRRPDASTPYANWLRVVFDRWYGSGAAEPEIRLFTEIIHGLLGGAPGSEVIGLSPPGVIVIETDGTIEQVDALKSAYEGAALTGMNVYEHTFEHVAMHPDIQAQWQGIEGLSDVCQQCPIASVCGGGYHPHRYREGNGFANPSVYCADLKALIGHVRSRISDDLSRIRGAE